MDNILETNKPLATAYYLYEDIEQIWMQKNKEEALGQLEYWCRQAQESKLYYFKKVAASLMARRTGISVWYDYKTPKSNIIILHLLVDSTVVESRNIMRDGVHL